jgi:hypothetical protein
MVGVEYWPASTGREVAIAGRQYPLELALDALQLANADLPLQGMARGCPGSVEGMGEMCFHGAHGKLEAPGYLFPAKALGLQIDYPTLLGCQAVHADRLHRAAGKGNNWSAFGAQSGAP